MRYISTLLLLFIISGIKVNAQIVSGNAFLQGTYVEVGIAPCGSFGTTSTATVPTGYHATRSGLTPPSMGFVADPDLDGWTVGTPDFVGDYFLPGTPEEGWGVTIGGVSYNNNLRCAAGTNQIPGSIINYNTSTSEVSATWQGTIGGITFTAKTYIPLNSAFFVTQVEATNTSAATIRNIYYMRNVDPDQGVYTPGAGGNYATNNTIANQNPNPCNRALVTAVTPIGSHYLGLGSIDARARVTHGGFSNRSAADIWNGVGLNTSGGVTNQDQAISISFKIDSLVPNEVARFGYAYILSASQLESALAATNLNFNVNGATLSSGSTSTMCLGTPVPVTINNAGTYTSWSWSPATGLNTTTGTSVVANITSPVTYTVVGTGPCGSTTLTITLNPVSLPVPGQAGNIAGPNYVMAGTTGNIFSVPPVPNATTYDWVLPPGSVITAGANTNTITFNASNSVWCGLVSVTPKNVCGTGGISYKKNCVYSMIAGTVPTPLCSNNSLTVPFTVTPTTAYFTAGNIFTAQLSDASGSFATPVYLGSIMGTTGTAITASIPSGTPPGSHYRVRIASSSPVTYSPDNGFDIIIDPPGPGIYITANPAGTTCTGSPITFTANIIGSGATGIVYQWKKNNVNVGTNSPTYTDNTLRTGDSVQVMFTHNTACTNNIVLGSNKIGGAVVGVRPTVNISANPGAVITAGHMVTFTATPSTGVVAPVYRWLKNNIPVPGLIGNTFSTNGLINGDVITVKMMADMPPPCPQSDSVESNRVVMTVKAATGVTSVSNGDTRFNLFPDPNNGNFTLSGDMEKIGYGKNVTIEIVNAVGQLVYRQEMPVSRKDWSVKISLDQSVANGIYMLKVMTDKLEGVKRFEVSR